MVLMADELRWVASPEACGRQDGHSLPHHSCRYFCFQTHTPVEFLRIALLLPLTRSPGLGWDGVSTFALSNTNGCWWVSGRESPCPPPPHQEYTGQRHPLHLHSSHVTRCRTKVRAYYYPTAINATLETFGQKLWMTRCTLLLRCI